VFIDPLNHPMLSYNGVLDVHIEDPNHCYYCKHEISPEQPFCGICMFPQRGTPEQQKEFLVQKRLLRNKRESVRDRKKETIIRLFILAGTFPLMTLFQLAFFGTTEGALVVIECIIETLLFTAAALLSLVNVRAGVVIASVLMAVYLILVFYLYGWLLIVSILGLMANAVRVVLIVGSWIAEVQAEKIRNELKHASVEL
jgi:hypothetical protein